MSRYEIQPLLISLLAGLCCLFLLRLGFYLYFVPGGAPLDNSLLTQSLYIGAKFDLRLLLFIHLPLILLSAVTPFKPAHNIHALYFWRAYFLILFAAILISYIFDFAYYAYLGTRLDASILRFAYNLDTSLHMVRQTYPVMRISLGIVAVLVILAFAVGKAWRLRPQQTYPAIGRRLATSLIFAIVMLTAAWAKLSWYPLRWSDAYHSTNEFASHLALNPVLYFLDTIKNRNINHDEHKTRQYYPLMAEYLGIDRPDKKNLSYIRRHTPQATYARRPNVIIVILESFAWYKTGLSGNPFNPTPHFDTIARQGTSFQRYYAPHGGTARSVWALITGLPDIEINRTSTRNPLVVNQHTIVNAFEGYEKFYFLGGSANWANIRGLLTHNIPGLRIYEEGSYQSARMDVWGISDLHLLEEANNILSRRQQPFLALIQTSGNHRPYNIPEDNRGFQVLTPDPDEIEKHGFRSVPDYNAMRFMDHALGLFMRQARRTPYYRDTLFVFLADHGNMRHAAHLPAYVEKLGITEFQSPLVIYRPGAAPRQINTIISQLDILPTIAAYASQPYTNTTLGRNMLDARHAHRQYAFTILHGRLPRLGIMGTDHYFTMYADGSKKRLHDLRAAQPDKNLHAQHPALTDKLQNLALALYETANYMRYHNPPLPADSPPRP